MLKLKRILDRLSDNFHSIFMGFNIIYLPQLYSAQGPLMHCSFHRLPKMLKLCEGRVGALFLISYRMSYILEVKKPKVVGRPEIWQRTLLLTVDYPATLVTTCIL